MGLVWYFDKVVLRLVYVLWGPAVSDLRLHAFLTVPFRQRYAFRLRAL